MSVRLTIDGRQVEVEDGATILDAARELGIEIPTLCHRAGVEPSASCFLCVVRIEGRDGLVPSCRAPALAGTVVTTDSAEIRAARRTALELLLSDHTGDCVAPCTLACPAGLDIPAMIRHLRDGETAEALRLIRRRIPLPGVLGRICPRYCERVCRRGQLDEPIAICGLARFAADVELAQREPDVPPCARPTGKKVAVVGSGPAGLTAAFFLRRSGHGCVVFDSNPEPGGSLRYAIPRSRLPLAPLEREIEIIRRMGAEFRMNAALGDPTGLERLRREYGAVFLAAAETVEIARLSGLETSARGIRVDRNTPATNLDGVFAGGEAVRLPAQAGGQVRLRAARGPAAPVRAVAEGRLAAECIGRYLAGGEVAGERKAVSVLMGRLDDAEKEALFRNVRRAPRAEGTQAGLTAEAAAREAGRCLQCDCLAKDSCRLRRYATEYGAKPAAFRGESRRFERDDSHSMVVYESGKCILCGLCVRIAEKAGARPGLAFVGRGFPVRVAVPFGGTLAEAMPDEVLLECAAACPTGALARRER